MACLIFNTSNSFTDPIGESQSNVYSISRQAFLKVTAIPSNIY